MGYTHYWSFNAPKRGVARKNETAYKTAVLACQKIVHAYSLGRVDDTRLSGYSAHCKPGIYGGLNFNGTADLSHEAFVLREHFKQNDSFNFCKTAQKPYDIVATACLATLKHYLGPSISVSSDGTAVDFVDGTALACKILGIKVQNPLGVGLKIAR